MLEELKLLINMHWKEIALNHDRIPLDPDWQKYADYEKAGVLHVVTARTQSHRLIGYYILFLLPHPHYRSTLFGFTDVYFIHPDFRLGTTGIRLFKFMEESVKERGVKLITSSTKRHRDVGRIFEYLGWRETERVYTKYVGD